MTPIEPTVQASSRSGIAFPPQASRLSSALPAGAAGLGEAEARLGAVAQALAVGGVALLALVLVQWLGHVAALSDEALRLAGLATIVVGNLAMLRWFRGGFVRGRHTNRVFHGLLLGVYVLSLTVLLVAPLKAAFGFPAALDPRWVLALLCVPAAWSLWQFVAARGGAYRVSPGGGSETTPVPRR